MSGSPDPKARETKASSPLHMATEIAVHLGALALVLGLCLKLMAPFIGIVVWSLIIAIALDRPFERLARMLGGRRKTAAVVFVLAVLVAMIVPAILLSETLVSGAQQFAEKVDTGSLEVPPPPDKIQDWPVIGSPLHQLWGDASQNLHGVLTRLQPQLEAMSKWLLGAAGAAGIAMLQLAISLVVAAAMMVRAEGRRRAMVRLFVRLAPVRGEEMADLTNATVRSVVQGIVGVAVIQSVLAGIGLLVAGVAGAGLWALLVLVSAVVQLPVLVVLLPPVLMVFSTSSTGAAVGFAVWCLVVSLMDNVLKPMLFGRGMKVPMLVIFLGAMGGMLTMGILGLFLGAVILALGYEILGAWLEETEEGAEASGEEAEPS